MRSSVCAWCDAAPSRPSSGNGCCRHPLLSGVRMLCRWQQFGECPVCSWQRRRRRRCGRLRSARRSRRQQRGTWPSGAGVPGEGDRRDRSRPLPRLMQLPAVQAAAAVARDASHASGFWRCQEHRTGDAARSLAPRLPHAGTASQICGAPDAQAPANRGRPRAWTCRNTPDGAGAGLHGAQNLRASPPTGCRRGRQWQRRRASPRCAQQGIFGNRAGQHGRQDRRRGAGAVDHV